MAIRKSMPQRGARSTLLQWPAAVEQQELNHSPERQGLIRPAGMGLLRPGMWGGRVKPEDVAGDEGPGWRVLFVDLAKMVVFVSFLALLWAGSAHLFACGEPKLGRLEVSFQKCEMRR